MRRMNLPVNRLALETSPYLLQHAHNPVDWYPWSEEALDRARHEHRPILISIGYSACHWCHVMEHESFEDPAVAEVMNRLFVCIKVDREERPDLDRVYQTAHQLLLRRGGGWPLTMFLDPEDRAPFFGGTYFPKEARFGLPAFPLLLERVAQYYHDHREALAEQNESVRAALANLDQGAADASLPAPTAATQAMRELASQFDAARGGFGGAPKFPHPTSLELLLAASATDAAATNMVHKTLMAMADGGIYDQLDGGFYRYSVDADWEIPHFEKMLYDNGPLLGLYAEAYAATGNPRYHTVAEETGNWLIREMQSPEGGFYSTLDADSEGHEGAFYVFTQAQLRNACTATEQALVAHSFGMDRPPNFEERWHLVRVHTPDQTATALGQESAVVTQQLENARGRLRALRAGRVRPSRDEKILVSWNGLAIQGLARAGHRLGNAGFLTAATRALDFIRQSLWHNDHLYAVYKEGRRPLNAYLDDYAFLLAAILQLLQVRWRDQDLEFACALADRLRDHFEDNARGGFFFTSDDHETLLYRPKPLGDDATPSGNAVAARALTELGHLLGHTGYLDAAERTLRAAAASVEQYPSGHTSMLLALQSLTSPPELVIVRGPAGELATLPTPGFGGGRLRFLIPDNAAHLTGTLAHLASMGQVTAWVCRGVQCESPVRDLSIIQTLLA